MSEQLWAPWRLEYVRAAGGPGECFLCAASAADADDEALLIVHRGERAVVVLNRFPYSSGHLLVAPRRHDVPFEALDDDEALALHRLAADGMQALAATFSPDGFNLGWNVGRVAGAGVADHVHLHVVPRWDGDTNFMPVLADVKVIPEHLQETRSKLANAWP